MCFFKAIMRRYPNFTQKMFHKQRETIKFHLFMSGGFKHNYLSVGSMFQENFYFCQTSFCYSIESCQMKNPQNKKTLFNIYCIKLQQNNHINFTKSFRKSLILLVYYLSNFTVKNLVKNKLISSHNLAFLCNSAPHFKNCIHKSYFEFIVGHISITYNRSTWI